MSLTPCPWSLIYFKEESMDFEIFLGIAIGVLALAYGYLLYDKLRHRK